MFSDNMVLQQQTDAPIWGESKPGKKVEIVTSWNGEKYTAEADSLGKWNVKVKTPAAGGPYSIIISDGKPVMLKNVMIGEVWLCSGQSNMEMQVEGWGKVMNYEQEKVEADNYPNIRFLLIKQSTAAQPVDSISAADGGWQVCSAQSVANFSAAAYFFGRDLHKYRNVPVGLIDTSWGGTCIETWTSKEALSAVPDLHERLKVLDGLPVTSAGRQQRFEDELAQWGRQTEKADEGFSDSVPVWASPDFDDSGWEKMNIPGWMQEQGLKNFNGVAWFRKTIDIPSKWNGKELTLSLGQVDDNDFTYFNGVLIGHSEGWLAPRTYKIPKKLVKKGKAVITVRVIDTGGTGGIGGKEEQLFIRRSESDAISLAGKWRYRASLNVKDFPPLPVNTANDPNIPTFLFNAMLHPLIPYAIKGAIWYQGEANAAQAYLYRELLPLMITDWRNRWGYDFPFYTVQLANFMARQENPSESAWAELREAQALSLHLANTGLAVAVDIGDANDIHPKNKQEVGRRLALAARAQTYGEDIPYSGPLYKNYRVEGNKIRISFEHADGGLKAKGDGKLEGFAIAGPDHRFHWADAVIEGNTVVVSSPEVDYPVAVRYAWADNPACNLYNAAGLPASPFRTDDWKGVTRGEK